MTFRHFEDFVVGETLRYGPWTVTREEIVAFATEFDPQPFHVDEAAARATPFGGLIASGWHVGCIWMRIASEGVFNATASLGSPGIDRLDWLTPVRPGDVLSGTSSVLETRVLRSRPEIGLVHFRHELVNQHRETVMRMDNPVMFGRRGTA